MDGAGQAEPAATGQSPLSRIAGGRPLARSSVADSHGGLPPGCWLSVSSRKCNRHHCVGAIASSFSVAPAEGLFGGVTSMKGFSLPALVVIGSTLLIWRWGSVPDSLEDLLV